MLGRALLLGILRWQCAVRLWATFCDAPKDLHGLSPHWCVGVWSDVCFGGVSQCSAMLGGAWLCLAVLGNALDLACFSRLRVRTRRARDIKTTRPVPSLASPAIHELAVGMCRETRPLLPTHWSLRGASLGPLTTYLFHRLNCSTTTELSSCYVMEQPIL